MKFKTALTAEEAALLAVGLDRYPDFRSAHDGLQNDVCLPSSKDCSISSDKMAENVQELRLQLRTAEEIYRALLDEIELADPLYPPLDERGRSCLVIANRAQLSSVTDTLFPEMCTVIKSSLVQWFLMHDPAIANTFLSGVNGQAVMGTVNEQVTVQKPQKIPATKTTNNYLKVIEALSEALVDGLTGHPNTDAEAVLAALALKQVNSPTGKETLAKYLKNAREL